MNIVLVTLAEASLAAQIGIPTFIIGILGLVFGVLLAIASKVFAVEVDPRVEEINEILPGANCGGCGSPGCSGYADAIVNKGEAINKCAPGGAAVVAQIAQIMGEEAVEVQRKVAHIHCSSGGIKNTNWRYQYQGVFSCKSAVNIAGGPNACEWGCVGFNDCVRACQFDAIHVDEAGMRHIDNEKCTGCGACASACPRKLIAIHPVDQKVHINCSSQARGPEAKAACGSQHSCIGCGICAKKCPEEAITVANFLAHIDAEKCTNCGACAEACPTKAILDVLAGSR